ncbi:hypothetical protein GPL21_39540 [Bradyrhizobium pachyrhizi]|uniref:Uncharacterized protein n=1 Tax=Bradyrhizobium pachyrhizi TaxID=280333 RepID=A0A844T934_9BRAD|nr:hypothetical protein [Bradyrhizobium pachyrhizi]MVT71140.1 hypothetical protein [Bradyrhizobium pachyrhizi]WFU56297.1 hypothetical protein QA639_01795 [Bradyrhizobium pachyrhizi]
MDREQAAELKKRLLNVGRALDRTVMAMGQIDQAERDALWGHLNELYEIVHRKLLVGIYAQHPDLKPPPMPPHFFGELTWSEVLLPPSVTEDQLDEVIFSLLKSRWRKVVAFVTDAEKRFKELGWTITYEATAARLQALSDLDRIESAGDLRYWGNSEVRLKH